MLFAKVSTRKFSGYLYKTIDIPVVTEVEQVKQVFLKNIKIKIGIICIVRKIQIPVLIAKNTFIACMNILKVLKTFAWMKVEKC